MSKLIIFGDSISVGAWGSQGGWAARLIAHLNKRTVQEENFYCMAYNLGVSGDSAPDVRKRMEPEISARHELGEPLVLILAIGVNDSQYLVEQDRLRYSLDSFLKELDQIAEVASKWSAKVLVLGPLPVDEPKVYPMPWAIDKGYKNKLVSDYSDALAKWCEAKNFPFIEMYQRWSSLNYQKLLFDGVHPNSEGHELIFNTLLGESERLNLFNCFIEKA